MSGEVKVDRELGKSRTHLTPPTPRSSSMSIRFFMIDILITASSPARPIPSDQTVP
jgi:hypothetical protein